MTATPDEIRRAYDPIARKVSAALDELGTGYPEDVMVHCPPSGGAFVAASWFGPFTIVLDTGTGADLALPEDPRTITEWRVQIIEQRYKRETVVGSSRGADLTTVIDEAMTAARR